MLMKYFLTRPKCSFTTGSNAMTPRMVHHPDLYSPSSAPKKGAPQHDESGQVFTEVTCPGGPMTADWVWKTKGSSREAGRYRSLGPGCSSLFNMAIRSTLCNSFEITAESLNEVPWEVACPLWQRLIASHLDSVRVWKAFATVYPNELDITMKNKQHVISRPNMKILDYVKPVTSLSFDWITFLTLSNVTCSRSDLIQISQLTNIGALTVGPAVQAPDIGLDDSLIRIWGRTAVTSNAFSMLRVLNCRSQREITPRAFDHFNQFPALAIFNAEDCKLGLEEKPMALQHGWKYRNGKDLSDWLVKGGTTGTGWDSIVHACFRLGGAFSMEALTAEGVAVLDALAVLHLSLGGPPNNAAVDRIGEQSLRSFYRMCPDKHRHVKSVRSSHKRPLAEVLPSGNNSVRKKPTVRAPRLQNIEDVLFAFGS